MIIYHHIVSLSSSPLRHYLVVLKPNVRYYNAVSLYSFCELVLGILTANSYFVLSLMHVRRVCLRYIYYSKISVDLVIRDKLCLLLAKLVQRAVNSIKIYIFVLLSQMFQNRFRYLFTVKWKQYHFKMFTDVFQAF